MPSARHRCNCDDCVDSRNKKKELQFGGTDTDLDTEELVRYRASSKTKKRYPRGCKGNDNKEHVYVWVPWDWGFGVAEYEEQRCAGCDKRKGFRRKQN